VIRVRFGGDVAKTEIIGPRNPKGAELTAELTITVDREGGGAVLATRDSRLATAIGQWSDWTRVKFKVGFMQSISGVVRFNLTSLQPFELHASPVNFAPDAPMFPISAPWDYAGELEDEIGTYYTAGMVEDHTGLMNGRIDEHAFLSQCDLVMREREGDAAARAGAIQGRIPLLSLRHPGPDPAHVLALRRAGAPGEPRQVF
jgi:hypothetical protein